MKKIIKTILLLFFNSYRNQQFLPGFLGVFMNPFYIIRRRLYKQIKLNAHFIKGKVLDYGCGISPYKNLFNYDEYIRADIENKDDRTIVLIDDLKNIYKNDYFDSILCTEVLEHVENYSNVVDEFKILLKPNGYLLLTTPFVWPVHGHPQDYRRFTQNGIEKMLSEKGFKILKTIRTSNYYETIIQLILFHVFSKLQSRFIFCNFVVSLFLSPLTIFGLFLSVFIHDKTIYLNNFIIAEKK
ncbi:MAG TPA: class I SAM-dependent methyltransferase [Bacteroidales bacterium]|nr:class I SAM-dependent methyltransferase [Bacteroidales bacterium]